jgi:uncharacterized membrane protein SpoIIM required for sporulation
VIIDVSRFAESGRPLWNELDAVLARMERDPETRLSLEELERFHYLYQRASADLMKAAHLTAERELRLYLENLVSRAYAEIHESRRPLSFHAWRWFSAQFPQTVRRHARALALSVALTIAGAAFGALAIRFDPDAKATLMPFQGLQMTPGERVAQEMKDRGTRLSGKQSRFSAQLMTHNTQVAVFTLGLGVSFGIGTIVVLFYNGVILGAVALDYVAGNQTAFLLGWLLPHGVIEIPAILVAGQAGLVLGAALIGWGGRQTRADRLRAVAPDLATLIGGVAIMLVWAGVVEAFLSQYHEPVLPYAVKIAFGAVEFALLIAFLWIGGRHTAQ